MVKERPKRERYFAGFLCAFGIWTLCLPPHVAAQSLQLLGHLDLPGAGGITDVWGYIDPATDIEYALVGNNWVGLQVVDVSNPANPILRTTVHDIPRQDIKSWHEYVYTVDGNPNLAGQDGAIVDFTDPINPTVVGSIPPAHNVFVDEEGYLYLSYPGLKIFDLNPDPTVPQLVWADSTHEGHDVCVYGSRLYDFSGGDGTYIYDVTSRVSPVHIATIGDPSITYHHSGWVTADGNYLYLNDEYAVYPAPDITVWYVPEDPPFAKVGEFADPNANVHNSYVVDGYLFAAYYTAGFRIFSGIGSPGDPWVAYEYDTSPLEGEDVGLGAWGCYPFTGSGNIFVSDRDAGLFVFLLEPGPVGVPDAKHPEGALAQNYPNPFNPTTTIEFSISSPCFTELVIYDTSGREVRQLVSEFRIGGKYRERWDGRDDSGRTVASGAYFYELRAGSFRESKRLVFLK